MVQWFNGFIIPLIEIVFILAFLGGISYFVFRAFYKVWSRSAKFIIKYKIFRNKYPEDKVEWIMGQIDQGIGYYDSKKFLYVNMLKTSEINEVMWIYDEIIQELNRGKGGKK